MDNPRTQGRYLTDECLPTPVDAPRAMTNDTQALLERLRYCETHGIFMAGLSDKDASYAEAADTIEALSSALAATERERDAMAEALQKIEAFDDGEQMADDVWDELMDIARAALPTKQEPNQ